AQALIPLVSFVVVMHVFLFGQSLDRGGWLMLIYCCIELEFCAYCFLLYRRLNKRRVIRPRTQEERRWLMHRMLEHPEGLSSILARWFLPLGKLRVSRARMEVFFAFSLFDRRVEDMAPLEVEQLDELLGMATKRVPNLENWYPEGSSSEMGSCMTMTHDPLVVQHKPLLTYMGIWIIQSMGYAILLSMGFRALVVEGIRYWIYMPKPGLNRVDDPPIFFVHGVGIGLVMYCKMVRELLIKKPNRPILLMELPHISIALSGQVPTMAQTLSSVDAILKLHKLTQCTFMAHSYGTIVTAWIVKERPQLISRLVLIDPVCFLVWEPSLIYNFLYSEPDSFTHFMCQYFISNDMYVSYTLRRNFCWGQNTLFPEFLTHLDTAIFLAENDYIIDANFIFDYLNRATDSNFVKPVLFPNLSHGNYLNSSYHMDIILNHV
ncbi:hypothetical protein L0F63_007484, partial [Massospora cicadina]